MHIEKPQVISEHLKSATNTVTKIISMPQNTSHGKKNYHTCHQSSEDMPQTVLKGHNLSTENFSIKICHKIMLPQKYSTFLSDTNTVVRQPTVI